MRGDRLLILLIVLLLIFGFGGYRMGGPYLYGGSGLSILILILIILLLTGNL